MARVGRPKKLKEEDYVMVEKLARTGLTKEMIADFLDYSYSAMYIDVKFMEVYKKGYTNLGAKVRTNLMAKMESDTTANIYLDKVINKTTEKTHDDNIELRRQQLEIERQRLELAKIQANIIDTESVENLADAINRLPKDKLEELMKKI